MMTFSQQKGDITRAIKVLKKYRPGFGSEVVADDLADKRKELVKQECDAVMRVLKDGFKDPHPLDYRFLRRMARILEQGQNLYK